MNHITLPSGLVGFNNTNSETVLTASGRELYLLHGDIKRGERDSLCPHCGKTMHIHNTYEVNLSHLNIGHRLSALRFSKVVYS